MSDVTQAPDDLAATESAPVGVTTGSDNIPVKFIVLAATAAVTMLIWRNPIVSAVLAIVAFGAYRAYESYQAESSEDRTIKNLPPTVQSAVAALDVEAQNAFFLEYNQRRKKIWVSYIIGFWPGWHYIYNGRVGMQFAFWFTFGGIGVWWFFDLMRMPKIVRATNANMAREALQTLSLLHRLP